MQSKETIVREFILLTLANKTIEELNYLISEDNNAAFGCLATLIFSFKQALEDEMRTHNVDGEIPITGAPVIPSSQPSPSPQNPFGSPTVNPNTSALTPQNSTLGQPLPQNQNNGQLNNFIDSMVNGGSLASSQDLAAILGQMAPSVPVAPPVPAKPNDPTTDIPF